MRATASPAVLGLSARQPQRVTLAISDERPAHLKTPLGEFTFSREIRYRLVSAVAGKLASKPGCATNQNLVGSSAKNRRALIQTRKSLMMLPSETDLDIA